MKLLNILCLCCGLLAATLPSAAQTLVQEEDTGSHWKEEGDTIDDEFVPRGLFVWTIEPRFGTVRKAEPDTMPHLFPNDAFTEGRTAHYNNTGNLGSPRISRIFTDYHNTGFANQFFFSNPYDFFITQPEQFKFTNTKSPITNLTYHKGGSSQNGEDRITGLFATNINKKAGIGFELDYLYGRGYYDSQAAAHFNGTLYGSYIGERYQMHTLYSANHLKNTENGGIENDEYVTNPENYSTTYSTSELPTRLTKTWNRLNVNQLFFSHRYNLGFTRYRNDEGKVVNINESNFRSKLLNKAIGGDSLQVAAATGQPQTEAGGAKALASNSDNASRPQQPEETDSLSIPENLTPEFVPVAGIIHTLRIEHNNRKLLSNLAENASSSTYFNDFYLEGDSANDLTKFIHVENTLALELREGFNNWVKSGMRLFARHDFYRFTLPNESNISTKYAENYISLGAQLLKEQGEYFHYNLLGELRTSGSKWGEFNVTGDADLNIPVKKDTLRFIFRGYVRNETPSFYYRHYHARNAWWDNSFDNEFRARAGAELRYKRTSLSFNIESIQNYVYLQESQYPYTDSSDQLLARYGVSAAQSSKNIQLMAVTLRQDFRLGILNWENELTYQLSSDNDLYPLPTFTAWSNLYLLFRIAKVLRTEFGADVRYFTKYKGLTYSPIIGQYVVQDADQAIDVGGYPVVNVYANFHLKSTRFYVMASHVNYSSGSGNPFYVPHYPLNRMVIRFGISWNFFN